MNLYDDLDFILMQLDYANDKKLTVQISPDHKDPIGELIKHIGTKEILIELLDILKEEGFIEYSLIDNTTQFHSQYYGMIGQIKLTVKGRLFVIKGKYKRKNRKETISTNLQLIATWAIVIGTFGLFVLEIIKMIYSQYNDSIQYHFHLF